MLSIRSQRIVKERAAKRAQERAAAAAEFDRQVNEFHREWLDRRRAATFLSISPITLKKWQLARKGPLPTKAGIAKQARVFWHIDELRRFARDPVGYNRARNTDPHQAGDTEV